MKTLTRLLGLTLSCVFLLFPRIIFAETLWSGNVHAGGAIEHSTTTPLETIAVEAGDNLAISAETDDEWRLFAEDNPGFVWTNADGFPGFEYEGIPVGALVGRIGTTGDWFFIGTDYNEEITETGILYLACWDFPGLYNDNDDFIHVTIAEDDKFHPADFDRDKDIDGADLAAYQDDMTLSEFSEFAQAYGFFEQQDNADLVELTVSAGSLTPAFSSERTDYLVTLDNSTDEIFITAVPADSLAGLTINDVEATSGVPFPVSLDMGSNFIRIDVESPDGSVVKNYSIVAVRDGIAALSDLTLTGYNLKPDFAPDRQVYNIDVENGVAAVTITPETDNAISAITVNNIPVPSGTGLSVSLTEGNNEIEVIVTAPDASVKIYYVFVRKTGAASDTVFVVDQSDAPDEFETLTEAINYLNSNLDPGQIGQIRIQTTSPMQVDALTITKDMFIIVEPGASNVISGPPGMPLVINALGGWNISGLSFTSSSGYTINAARGLSIVGSSFSGDTVVNVNGATGFDAEGNGDYAKGFEFVRGILSGYLKINLTGYADYDFKAVGTNAVGITFDALGDFVGDAGLILKANPISDLKINASLKGNAKAEIMGHGGVSFSKLGFKLEENASVQLKNNIMGTLEAEFNGLKGQVDFKNVTTVEADLDVNMEESTFTGNANTYTNWSFDVGYSSNLTYFGLTERGGYAFKKVQINAEDAPTNAEIVIGFDSMDFSGNLNLFAGGKAKVTMNNGTILKLDAFLKFPGNIADLQLHDIQGKAKFSVLLPDSETQFYISAARSNFHEGMTFDTATDKVSGKLDAVTTVLAGVAVGIPFGEIPDLDSRGIQSLSTERFTESTAENELIFENLNIKATDKPGLCIKNVSVPVTVRNSTIDAPLWSIVCADVDAEVTITDNSNLKGGIMLDGDPDMAGVMIDQQYTVSNNTITQNSAGGSCLSSHAIRNISVTSNTMTAPSAGSHGITLNGGKMIVSGGGIITAGPYICNAIGLGPSAGGANAILYADSVNPITGGVVPAPQGYVKLTNNTFANGIVFDHKSGRLLNDPVSDNSGLDPDEHVVGSLIDWNDDDHNCPDYPTDCDEWDEDLQECGCGEDGIDPPTEPGL